MLTGTTSDGSAHAAAVLDGPNAVARACKVTSAALNDLKSPQIANRQMMSDSPGAGSVAVWLHALGQQCERDGCQHAADQPACRVDCRQ